MNHSTAPDDLSQSFGVGASKGNFSDDDDDDDDNSDSCDNDDDEYSDEEDDDSEDNMKVVSSLNHIDGNMSKNRSPFSRRNAEAISVLRLEALEGTEKNANSSAAIVHA